MKQTVIPSRIIGLIMVLIFLIACNSMLSTQPSSIRETESATTKITIPTETVPLQTEIFPEPTHTDLSAVSHQIEVIRDIPYTSQGKLDVYQPDGPGPWPVVVALHGGGQSKELFNVFSKRIAELGAVVFTPTWHSSEPQGDPLTKDIITAGNQDAACALRFARQRAKDFDGDPSRLVVVGYSGGGTAGAVIALAGDEFEGDCLVSGHSSIPDAFIGIDGAYDLVNCCVPDDLYKKGSPEDWALIVPFTYLDRQFVNPTVKFSLIVGGTPELVEMAETFNDRLQEVGIESTLTQFPDLDHGQIVSLNLPELFAVIEDALYP
ncbi:MAG: alpha/beta hydrolase [Chloroflexota bacterium]|nr:MAG: alpha/beta hydrolase [Chloroflexota bacterium]